MHLLDLKIKVLELREKQEEHAAELAKQKLATGHLKLKQDEQAASITAVQRNHETQGASIEELQRAVKELMRLTEVQGRKLEEQGNKLEEVSPSIVKLLYP